MELVYLWVKKYKCFDNQGFNFSPKHEFKFNCDTWLLEYYENREHIDNFFNYNNNGKEKSDGQIENLTAVVGGNGSGKSTLTEIISNNIASGEDGMTADTMVIFWNGIKMLVYYNYLLPYEGNYDMVYTDFNKKKSRFIRLKTDEQYNNLFITDPINNNKLINGLMFGSINCENKYIKSPHINDIERIHGIYHSNVFDSSYNVYKKAQKLIDISTIGLMNSDNQYQFEMHLKDSMMDPNVIFFHEDLYRQIQFIYDYKVSNQYIPFALPSYARVKFSQLNTRIDLIYEMLQSARSNEDKYINANEKKKEKYSEGLHYKIKVVYHNFDNLIENKRTSINLNEIIKYELIYNIVIGIFTQFLYQIIIIDRGAYKEERRQAIYDSIEEVLENLNEFTTIEGCFTYIVTFFEKLLSKKVNEIELFKNNIKHYIEFIKYVSTWLEVEFDNLKYNIDNKEFYIKIKKDGNGLREFYNAYKKTALYCNYLDFSWPLSSGENNYLSLFARFYYSYVRNFKDKVIDKNELIIILIDEADLTFHPKWQQCYMKSITEFLKNLYKNYKIQIIITTHSPIILSDIPKSNVIFIRKTNDKVIIEDSSKHCETFAANISTLFYDSFFMDKGSIGDIAKEQINKLLCALKPIEKKID